MERILVPDENISLVMAKLVKEEYIDINSKNFLKVLIEK